ncbi:MAG: FkbM family methyltransferase [Verrucomicrobiia bacterium]
MDLQPASAGRSFFAKANDLQSRDLASRLSRAVRARFRRWGAACATFADDPRVVRAWRKGWDPSHFIQMQRWQDEGFRPRVVYDIGAHVGLWSEMCQALFAPEQCVLFEPQREAREKAAARQTPGARWQILGVALGDREESHALHVTRNSAASSLLAPLDSLAQIGETEVGSEKVDVVPLDALAQSKGLPAPDFVKIDVQGFEGRVLAGGSRTLQQARRMVIEVSLHPLYDGQSLVPEVLHTLTGWNFELEDVQETFRQWPGRLWQVDLWLRRTN